MMAGQLAGQVAIVTGGATGIGAAITRLFAANGATVVVASNQKPEDLDDFCASVEGGATALLCDVTRQDSVSALVAETGRRFGSVDILVNCAGVFQLARLEDLPIDMIDAMLSVNIAGPILLSRAVLPVMRRQGHGSIINIASVGAILATEGCSVYAASKAALMQFTKTVAGELAHSGIRINAIGPGPVRTPMAGFLTETPSAEEARMLAEKGASSYSPYSNAFTEPAEIARIALFLASPDSRAIQGAFILADEGMSAVAR